VSKAEGANRLAGVFESLSDVTVTVVADFTGEVGCTGTAVAVRLAELGVGVFPVGVVGEDEAGQRVLKAMHDRRISTSGISKIKKYVTPVGSAGEPIHGEDPALVNLVDHARKFAAASDAMYMCDCGVGAASPRVLNFIKSNGCVREKTLVARSLHRLMEFEQLTAAVAAEAELEQAIAIDIRGTPEKLAVAAEGMLQELAAESFVAVSVKAAVILQSGHKFLEVALARPMSGADLDILGGVYAAALATGAATRDAAELALRLHDFYAANVGKKACREDLLVFLSRSSASRRAG
jgi:hypothetical protein